MDRSHDAPAAERPYDEGYAVTYADRWWSSEAWDPDRQWFESTIRSHLPTGEGEWLDVGCGTGYFLSKFPSTRRAGLDLSPDMVEVARGANPGVDFRVGDTTEPYPEWEGRWDLVTCTGEPWSYLTTLAQFERWVENMAAWTSPGGVCLNQTPDITELAFANVDYRFTEDEPPPGTVTVLGVMWDMNEVDVVHGQMIWPSIDIWARWYGRHFARVEVLHPEPGSGVIFGRTIRASEKRRPGDDRPTTYIYEPPPATESGPTLEQQLDLVRQEMAEIHRIAKDLDAWQRQLIDLLARPGGDVEDERYDILGVVHEQVGGIRRELADLASRTSSGFGHRSLPRRVIGRARRRLGA